MITTSTYTDALEGAYFKALHNKVTLPDNSVIPAIPDGLVVPVFRDFVDIQRSDKYYILIQNPSAVGAESKCDTDQNVSIQLVLYCRGAYIDTGNMPLMAAQVYNLVYPNREHELEVTGYQNINQRLVSDRGESFMDETVTVKILQRILIFNHSLS